MANESNVTHLARVARVMDAAVRIPGTDVRIGLDAVIGLIPGIGDLSGAAISGYIVLAAVRAGVPGPVLTRMLLNIAIDTGVGAVPVIGDLFDVAWRSNTRNVALLERHLAAPTATRAASRGIVIAALVGLALLLAAALAGTVLGLRALAHLIRA